MIADITRTKEKISVVYLHKAKIDNGIAAAALEAGQPVYIHSNGKYNKADANAAQQQISSAASPSKLLALVCPCPCWSKAN